MFYNKRTLGPKVNVSSLSVPMQKFIFLVVLVLRNTILQYKFRILISSLKFRILISSLKNRKKKKYFFAIIKNKHTFFFMLLLRTFNFELF